MSSEDEAKKLKTDRLLQVHHVAARLGVAPRTIRYWAEIGELPGFKVGLRQWRFRESEIEEYIERKRYIA